MFYYVGVLPPTLAVTRKSIDLDATIVFHKSVNFAVSVTVDISYDTTGTPVRLRSDAYNPV